MGVGAGYSLTVKELEFDFERIRIFGDYEDEEATA